MLTRHKKPEKADMEDESVMKNSEEQSANANLISVKAVAPTNLDIMEAITNLSGSFDKKLEAISTTLLEVNVSLASMSNRVAQTEEATKAHEIRIESLERILHHYQVKEHILRLARSKPLEYDGRKIHVFPDLAADVLKQRQKFDNIRKKCREHEVRCGFRFPSKFMVTVSGKETRVFESPESVEVYLRGAVENW
ncbi:hypothetical protein E1301_Tti020149 [Triplophysa tibetana]|uniref:LINE-1 type transposase domain-containing protein 1 ES cell-associated protein 11 n=1 Tax=Triplophysa tibetana TaxID=1572043 RepID=A0A5A9NXK8_9TELE|nr:hypothetical protein E1301_Tti020149 [Triplophysa tibetana]